MSQADADAMNWWGTDEGGKLKEPANQDLNPNQLKFNLRPEH